VALNSTERRGSILFIKVELLKNAGNVASHLKSEHRNYFVATKVSSGYLVTGYSSDVRFISHIDHHELRNIILQKD